MAQPQGVAAAVAELPQLHESCDPEQVPATVARMVSEQGGGGASNVLLVPGYATAGDEEGVLQQWARAACGIGDSVVDSMYYWAGHEALPGEDVAEQFARQLLVDFDVLRDEVVAEGVPVEEANVLSSCHTGPLQSFLRRCVRDFQGVLSTVAHTETRASSGEITTASSERDQADVVFLQVTFFEAGEEPKFFDAQSGIVMETTLAGSPPVLAPAGAVHWDAWRGSHGGLLEDLAEEMDDERATAMVQEFNAAVCPPPGELQPPCGDLTVSLTGEVTPTPCLRRDAYALTHQGEEAVGLRVTLQAVTAGQAAQFREMLLSEDAVEEDCGAAACGTDGCTAADCGPDQ